MISRAQALAEGLPRYFTGEPCLHGHVVERLVSTWACVECNRLAMRAFRKRNPESVKKYNDLRDPEKKRESYRRNYQKNIEHWRTYHREKASEYYYNDPALAVEKKSRYQKERRERDISFRLAGNLRNRLVRILKGSRSTNSAVRNLGCTPDELRVHLERQFAGGMSWENYGTAWHIDHRKPLSAFDLTDRSQFLEACHFTNLQPLFVLDNLKKGGAKSKQLCDSLGQEF